MFEFAMFDWITGTISKLGYVGVAALTFLENLFPPIPSELILPLAGFVAARGDMTIGLVIFAGSVGSLAGAYLWYDIGRRVGERRLKAWVRRHGKWITLSERDVERAQQWFHRHGRAAVLLGRMVPGVRTFVSLPAGFSAMPVGTFLLYSTIGTVGWTAALALIGLVLESQYTRVADWIDIVSNVLLAGFLLIVAKRYVDCWRSSR